MLSPFSRPTCMLHHPAVCCITPAPRCRHALRHCAAKPKARELRGYTRAEVAQHKAEDDLWLIIKNKGSDRLKVGGAAADLVLFVFNFSTECSMAHHQEQGQRPAPRCTGLLLLLLPLNKAGSCCLMVQQGQRSAQGEGCSCV